MKVSKQLKTSGKATFEGPNVKDRKKFAPATKTESPKKGKGSYDRKSEKNLSEDEETKKSCWKGYKKDGTKKKGGKTVNNCVPIKESSNIEKFIDCIIEKKYAQADKYLKREVESKLQGLIAKEIDTPLF